MYKMQKLFKKKINRIILETRFMCYSANTTYPHTHTCRDSKDCKHIMKAYTVFLINTYNVPVQMSLANTAE